MGLQPDNRYFSAVLGLIQAMQFITDPEKLGVATAFIATIYGVGLANLLFLPMANKLKQQIEQKMLYHELLAEGIIAISQGESPLNIELKLEAYRVDRPSLLTSNIMLRRRLRQNTQKSQHTERWLVSYADYMTIMFAFFVVMYAIAISKNEDFQIPRFS